MTYNNGEVTVRSQEEWMNILLNEGSDFWSEDIVEGETPSAIKYLYEPFAGRLSSLEEELQSVLESLQITEATGGELDIIGERYGITRNEPTRASGRVTMSRSSSAPKDYLIQAGTIVQTDTTNPLQFQTTEQKKLEAGATQITIEVESINEGNEYNVVPGELTQLPAKPNGIESVTNNQAITGGVDKESDSSYRQRILTTLRNSKSASGWNIYKKLTSKEFVNSVLFTDVKSDTPTPNLQEGDFEVTIDAERGYEDEIAQLIFENSPMGSNPVAGNRGKKIVGQASLPNGQKFDIEYSEPEKQEIHIEARVKTSQPISSEKIINNIVSYIGGKKVDGSKRSGKLGMGDDVIYGNVDFHLRELVEVVDVDNLKIGKTSSPSETSSISIDRSQFASVKASNINIITI